MTCATAQGIAQELKQVAKDHRGLLPAEAVVDWARSHPQSELHSQFTWDDGEAADKWRLHQARNIILKVTIEFPKGGETTRAWVNLPSDRTGDSPVYRPIVRVMTNMDMRRELLESVKAELGRLREKHANLTELASVWNAIAEATSRG
jgi:hypothetical protein